MKENPEYVKSLNEKEINTRALEALILAFNSKNAQLFDEILHDDGVFLDNLTKNETLDFFQDQFYNRRFGLYPPATVALYWDDLSEPETGGTGVTLGFLRFNEIAAFNQEVWGECL